jgi:hypothetical protein
LAVPRNQLPGGLEALVQLVTRTILWTQDPTTVPATRERRRHRLLPAQVYQPPQRRWGRTYQDTAEEHNHHLYRIRRVPYAIWWWRCALAEAFTPAGQLHPLYLLHLRRRAYPDMNENRWCRLMQRCLRPITGFDDDPPPLGTLTTLGALTLAATAGPHTLTGAAAYLLRPAYRDTVRIGSFLDISTRLRLFAANKLSWHGTRILAFYDAKTCPLQGLGESPCPYWADRPPPRRYRIAPEGTNPTQGGSHRNHPALARSRRMTGQSPIHVSLDDRYSGTPPCPLIPRLYEGRVTDHPRPFPRPTPTQSRNHNPWNGRRVGEAANPGPPPLWSEEQGDVWTSGEPPPPTSGQAPPTPRGSLHKSIPPLSHQ